MDQENEASQQALLKQKSKMLPLPPWPTSKPGSMVTELPPGQNLMPLRTDQVVEIDYDQNRGVPAASRTEE
jgi:hypothetical protein